MNFPKRGTRTDAVYDYILKHAALNDGAVPPLRALIEDRVGEDTRKGAITTVSVVAYHFKKLCKNGLLKRNGRRYSLVGCAYAIPRNLYERRSLLEHRLIMVDAALLPRFEDEAARIEWLDRLGHPSRGIVAISLLPMLNPTKLLHFHHPKAQICIDKALRFTNCYRREAAVITNDDSLVLAAIGMDIAVYGESALPGN